MTAICAPVVFCIAGFGVDYGYASYINQKLAKATDAAILAAVSQTAATASGGYGNTSGLQTFGTNVFNANIAQMPVSNVSFSLSVVGDGTGGVIATATYSYNSPTFFGGVIGMRTIPMSGTVKSTTHPTTYINYYIIVDASQSMGIAATQADMTALFNRVKANNNGGGDIGCVFACHVIGPGQSVTNEDLAHNITKTWGARINLRIDAAVSAIQDVVSAASSVAGTTRNIKFGLYVMQQDVTVTPNTYVRQIAPTPPTPQPAAGTSLSSDYTAVAALAANIDLGNNIASGRGDSAFTTELTTFNTTFLGTNGTGASASSPLNYVFIITDGVADTYGCFGNGFGHCVTAFDPINCTALKAKATVGVIYTTYLPIYTNNDPSQGLDYRYTGLVSPIANQISPNLQSCATSTDYFYSADDGPSISAAMQALFLKTQPVTARITQ